MTGNDKTCKGRREKDTDHSEDVFICGSFFQKGVATLKNANEKMQKNIKYRDKHPWQNF